MIYDNVYFWFAKMLNWTEIIPSEVEDAYKSVVKTSNNILEDVVNKLIVTNKIIESVEKHKGYIKWPQMTIELFNGKKIMPFLLRIRINPCFQFPGKNQHYSKVCVVIQNHNGFIMDGNEIGHIFNSCRNKIMLVIDEIAEKYLNAIQQDLKTANAKYHIESMIVSIKENEETNKKVNKFFNTVERNSKINNRLYGSRIAKGVYSDVRNWDKDIRKKYAINDTDDRELQYIKSSHGRAILLAKPYDSMSSLTTVSQIVEKFDRSDCLREMILPTLMKIIYNL